jgi:hypothetical protein
VFCPFPTNDTHGVVSADFGVSVKTTWATLCALFSFRMIGDTRIECQDANSAWEDTESKTVGSHRTGAEPRSPASAEVDEPLSTAGSQRELYLPALWNQSAEFLSLVETV